MVAARKLRSSRWGSDVAQATQRPAGIPTLEDKILQRAVTMLLERIYEQMFYDCSHGFRPKRSAHHALREIRENCMNMGTRWILDADIKGYFDSIRRDILREFLRKKMNDGTIIRFIGKWLNAGVLEEGNSTFSDLPTTGRGQNGDTGSSSARPEARSCVSR